ncbi:MAG: trypco2 family protein [Nostoc sp. DedQUE04]|uniref:trypco2 family protein n=1 Tax=Nostoc sp. DedQUE04 TaxID=3075390 RepID=UPI002AD3C233|nr:trypco2 family protein [Nostoc sp. DedQUE04]MDZ8138251.1 trypco2 family protein [Nostoc sp. DedQUE04]
MSDENLIGLAELIQQVKRELLTTYLNDETPSHDTDIPVFSVDSVELELQVTLKKEGKGGVKIYVLELGGGSSRDDVQKVKLTLSPLLKKEQLLGIYKKLYPERWQEFLETSVEALTKGNEGNLSDQF